VPPLDAVSTLAEDYRLHLRSANRAERTVETYSEALRAFETWLKAEGHSNSVRKIEPRHIRGFLLSLQGKFKPATVHNRYRALKTFFAWLEDEEEIGVYR
jgi:site-specific recombinase XerD